MDYTSLKSMVASWLARADLTAQIPQLIELAELRLRDDIEGAEQVVALVFTTSNGIYDLPADFEEAQTVSLSIGGAYTPIFPLTATDALRNDLAALPVGYYITSYEEETGLRLFRLNLSGGADYSGTIVYRAAFPALSDTAPENWLLTRAPNLYLYAALLEAMPLIQDDARIQVWATAYSEALGAFNRSTERTRYGNNPRRKVDFCAP